MRILNFIHNNKEFFYQDLQNIANTEYDDDDENDNKHFEHVFDVSDNNTEEFIIVEIQIYPQWDYTNLDEVTLMKVEFEITDITYFDDDHHEFNINSNAYKQIINKYIN